MSTDAANRDDTWDWITEMWSTLDRTRLQIDRNTPALEAARERIARHIARTTTPPDAPEYVAGPGAASHSVRSPGLE